MIRRAPSLRSPHDREIRLLALPALGALVADPVLSAVDTAFVGRIDADALAALGVSTAVFHVAFFVFNFLGSGTTSLVARAVGAGDRPRAGRAVVLAFATAGVAGVVAALVLEIAVGPIVGAMGADESVRDGAVAYIRIRALAAPAVLAVLAGHGAYRGFQDTRTPFLVALGVNVINLVLDPVLIFGLGWGIAGAAWATVLAQWTGAAIFIALVFRLDRDRLGVIPGRPDLGELWDFLRVGRDLGLRTGSLLAAFTLATAVATRVSATAVAAHQVVMQLWLLLSFSLDALAVAGQALVGRYLGSGRPHTAAAVADRLLALGVAIGVGLALMLAALPGTVPGWFSGDDAVIEQIRSIWPFLVLSQPLNAAVFVWDGVFIGAGDFAFLALATAAAAAVSAAVLLSVLPAGWGLAGVWWGVSALLAARAVTLAWRRVAPRGPLRIR